MYDIQIDLERDNLLTDFGKKTLMERYLLQGERFQDMFSRVANAFADDQDHAQRLYDYMSKLWFMPSTPILSNGGANRGLPISCFINSVDDSLQDIVVIWNENVALASNGGGIGSYWGGVRSMGESIAKAGSTSGIVPFIKVMDSMTLAISQGSLRRGSAAVYLDIFHPEIEEFIELRKASGDFNRKALNLHHGVNIDNKFMEAVKNDTDYDLISPKTKKTLKSVSARELWQKILDTRMQTGEPYLIFSDTVNDNLSAHQKKLGLKVTSSNLCAEIVLPTGKDHKGNDRTAVCCLSSVNAETYDQWKNNERFVEDILRMLDNVLQQFIDSAPDSMSKAIYSAQRERSVGLGLMGFHSLLQAKKIPFESPMAKSINMNLFKHLKAKADEASLKLGEERGPCLDAEEVGSKERFSHKLSVAPTASISVICGGASACIEPIPANVYTHKTLDGSFTVKNKALRRLLQEKNIDNDTIWHSILEHDGSVQHLPQLSDYEKEIFKTAFEIDQRWVLEFASDRTPYICQSQSVNLYLSSDVNKWDLHMLHWIAWKSGMKSLYYCRSKSIMRAGFAGSSKATIGNEKHDSPDSLYAHAVNYEECLSCQ